MDDILNSAAELMNPSSVDLVCAISSNYGPSEFIQRHLGKRFPINVYTFCVERKEEVKMGIKMLAQLRFSRGI